MQRSGTNLTLFDGIIISGDELCRDIVGSIDLRVPFGPIRTFSRTPCRPQEESLRTLRCRQASDAANISRVVDFEHFFSACHICGRAPPVSR